MWTCHCSESIRIRSIHWTCRWAILSNATSPNSASPTWTPSIYANTWPRFCDSFKSKATFSLSSQWWQAFTQLSHLILPIWKQFLIIQKAWSILYHSILTLVLLMLACLIWVVPSSRSWCLRISPLFVVYSVALFCLEFIYGLQLDSLELPEYKEIGLVRHQVPFLHLATKVFMIENTFIHFDKLKLFWIVSERADACLLAHIESIFKRETKRGRNDRTQPRGQWSAANIRWGLVDIQCHKQLRQNKSPCPRRSRQLGLFMFHQILDIPIQWHAASDELPERCGGLPNRLHDFILIFHYNLSSRRVLIFTNYIHL